ncbi:MAG: DUF4268 domain-containing protein [Pirellulaceae bacterium]
MKANAQPLQEILHANAQFLIPFFQRSYSWERGNWERIVDDVHSLLEEEPAKKHFLGPLVCALISAAPGKLPQFQLIDGQQRLTTLSLLLTAIRNEARENGDDEFADEIEDHFLVNKYKKGLDRYKLIPRTGDRELFAALIDRKKTSESTARLIAAHEFFRKVVRTHAHNDPTYLRRCFDVIAGRLYLVTITLDEEDPYEIFESLNSTGLPLQESDLIRNFLFMQIQLADQEEFQKDHWEVFEKEFEPTDRGVVVGPTGFYRDFLMREGKYSKAKETFADFKKFYDFETKSPAEIVSELHRYVVFAKQIAEQGKGLPLTAARAIRHFSLMDTSTANPVVLNLLNMRDTGEITDDNFVGCVSDLNSFLLRRSICGESTRAYGRWFSELAGQISGEVREQLQGYLLRRGWPDDETFEKRLAEFPVYRREFKKCRIMLEMLEQSDGQKEVVDLTKDIQIEHVMPQKLPGGVAGKQWKEMLGDQHKKIHDRYLHTIGNLTLTGYNQSLGNRGFAEKKTAYQESKFSLNKYFTKVEAWNEEEISKRTQELGTKLTKLWQRPKGDIVYVPPTKAETSENKGRDRRIRYWKAFSDLLTESGVHLRPVRMPEGQICSFFLDMADVNLLARIVPNQKQLLIQLRFSRTRGQRIYEQLETQHSGDSMVFSNTPAWDSRKNSTITWTKSSVSIRDHYDWLEHHKWLISVLGEIESKLLADLRLAHDQTKEKSASKQLLLDYWIALHRRLFERRCSLSATTPLPQDSNDFTIGRSGFWQAAKVRPAANEISVLLLMDKKQSPICFPQLESQKSEIEAEFGSTLDWERPERLLQWRIGTTLTEADPSDRDDWPRQHDWIIDRLLRVDKVFRDRIRKLDAADYE